MEWTEAAVSTGVPAFEKKTVFFLHLLLDPSLHSPKPFLFIQSPMDTTAADFIRAAELGDLALLQQALEAKADPKSRSSTTGASALTLASKHGHLNMIRFLVNTGVGGALDHDREFNTGDTALCSAARHDQLEAVELLLALKASVTSRSDSFENYPLLAAAEGGSVRCVDALLKARASLFARDTRSEATVVMHASRAPTPDVLRYLADSFDLRDTSMGGRVGGRRPAVCARRGRTHRAPRSGPALAAAQRRAAFRA